MTRLIGHITTPNHLHPGEGRLYRGAAAVAMGGLALAGLGVGVSIYETVVNSGSVAGELMTAAGVMTAIGGLAPWSMMADRNQRRASAD